MSWCWTDAKGETIAKGATVVGEPTRRRYCTDDGGAVEHAIGASCAVVPAGAPDEADGGMCTLGACM